jgi:hypothetical protein
MTWLRLELRETEYQPSQESTGPKMTFAQPDLMHQSPNFHAEGLRRSISHRQHEQGVTTAELAERCGWSEAEFVELTASTSQMTIIDLRAIARALNTDTVRMIRDADAFAAGGAPVREQQLVCQLPQWATSWFSIELPVRAGNNDQAWLYSSRDTRDKYGNMEIRAEIGLDDVTRQVVIKFDRTPTFSTRPAEHGESSRYTLAEARSVAGRPDSDPRVRAALRELLDAYDAV